MNQHFYVRQGVSFQEMTSAQRDAAFGLLRAALSAQGMQLTRDIMRLNETLAELTDDHEFLGEWLYYITVMGKPSASEPWGFQLDGHHAIVNYFVLGDQVVMTPHFAGSEPVRAASGKYEGTVVLQQEQDQGLAMVQGLSEAQRSEGGADVLEDRQQQPDRSVQGQRRARLRGRAGRRLGRGPEETAARSRRPLRRQHGRRPRAREDGRGGDAPGATRFAWIGGVEPTSIFYYRIHSPVMLIEFDHQRPANLRDRAPDPQKPTREHIHVVVRTPNGNDYGKDLLRQHYLAHKHEG